MPGFWFLVPGSWFPSLKPKDFIHEKTQKDTKVKKSEEDACERLFRAIRVPSWINPASCLSDRSHHPEADHATLP
jgi:hypothetical protein